MTGAVLLNETGRPELVYGRCCKEDQLEHEVWVTEAVLIEVANAFSKINREVAAGFIERCYNQAGPPGRNLRIVSVDTALLRRGLTIYEGHHDKQWGLTDCISFVIMKDRLLTDALTADRHFVQAGFRALMFEEA